MARQTRMRQREAVRPKPVQKVELSEEHLKLRTVLMIVFLLIGVTAIGLGVSFLFGTDSGWREIEASSAGVNCAGDFTLLYRLGEEGIPASQENRAIAAVYSAAAERGYRLFTADEEFEDLPNVAYLNSHPNQEVEVDEGLYKAFAQIQEAGDRSLYLGPVYARYDDLFDCSDDSQTVDFDPYENPEVKAEYAEAAAFARDSGSVDLELLGGNRVRLKISKEYLAWAKENGASRFLDFSWMKNAFLADYLAEALIESGYTRGCLSSFDGFVRNLDGSGEPYSLSLYDRVGETVYPAAVMEYTGPVGLVYLRDYGLSEPDRRHYYQYADGTIRTSYLDVQDGLCRSSRGDLLCWSREEGCAQVLLQMIPVYIAEEFQEKKLDRLLEDGIYSVYAKDRKIICNDPQAAFRGLYQGDDATYTVKEK